MQRFCWWVAELLSRTLEAEEREAVSGDIVEAGASGIQAVRDLLGLVVRRQSALWKSWKPWAALAGLAIFGFLLSQDSRRAADRSAVFIWLYANNWDSMQITNAALRSVLAQYTEAIALMYLALACRAWLVGFVAGYLSGRAALVNAALFTLMALIGVPMVAPHGTYVGHIAVFSVFFYHAIFPWIVQVILILLPGVWGMRHFREKYA